MTKRVLLVVALAAALAVPAVALADDNGGTTSAAPAAAHGVRSGRLLERISNRLDKRFQAFSSRCLVANAPEQCAKAANRFVRRLDRLQQTLQKVESRIKERCGAANAPALCSRASTVTQAIDSLLATIASDTAAIKAAFPNAGSA